MKYVPTNVMSVTANPTISAPISRLRLTYRASAAKMPAPRTHGTKGMVSQKSNVAHAPMRLPTKTATEAIASEPDAILRTLCRAY